MHVIGPQLTYISDASVILFYGLMKSDLLPFIYFNYKSIYQHGFITL